MSGGGGFPHPGGALPSGDRWRNRFLARYCLVVAAGSLSLLLGVRAVLRIPLEGGYGDVYRALRFLDSLLPLLLALLLVAWALLVAAALAALCVSSFHRVAGPACRMERVADELASGAPVEPLRFREGDAGGDMAEAFDGFVEALRRDRDACLSLLDGAARAEGGEAARREAALRALREVHTLLSRYR